MANAPLLVSANLGFLYSDITLPDRIHAAKQDGFDAVELHWPYETPDTEIARALAETGLPCICLNTRRGDASAGEFGLGALPEREKEARAHVDEAITYARAIGCRNVHVMAGRAKADQQTIGTFVTNLVYAADKGRQHDIGVLIEPINTIDVPGYFLSSFEQAEAVMSAVDRGSVGMMFDIYHAGRMSLDITETYTKHAHLVRHVQFAGVPSRSEPDASDIDVADAIAALRRLGYRGAFGAEYHPKAGTHEGLGWLRSLRRVAEANP